MLKKILFMGSPIFAVPILKSLYQNGYPVSVVYTQPPKKSKRGQKINPSPVEDFSKRHKIKIRNSITSFKYLRDVFGRLCMPWGV